MRPKIWRLAPPPKKKKTTFSGISCREKGSLTIGFQKSLKYCLQRCLEVEKLVYSVRQGFFFFF